MLKTKKNDPSRNYTDPEPPGFDKLFIDYSFHMFQWYRPRSLVNLEDDTSSIWSGIGKSTPTKEFSNTTQVI